MRIAVASAGVLRASISWSRQHLRSSLLAAGSSALLLVGCASDYSQKNSSTPGSKSQVPLPKQALLAPPKEPACSLESSGLKTEESRAERTEGASTIVANLAARERFDESNGLGVLPLTSGTVPQPNRMLVQTDPNASLSQRIKLEYERNCFQRAEIQLREHLLQLQAAIGKTIRSVKRIGRSDPTKAP